VGIPVEAGCCLDLRIGESPDTPPTVDALPFKVGENRRAVCSERLGEVAHSRSSLVMLGKCERLILRQTALPLDRSCGLGLSLVVAAPVESSLKVWMQVVFRE